MTLYNVSIIIDDTSHDDMLAWIKNELQLTSYEVKFLKMLDSPHEGSTYCIQLITADPIMIAGFQSDFMIKMQTYIGQKHADKAFIFDSKMEYVTIS